MKSVATATQEVRGASADDHAIPFLRYVLHDSLADRNKAVGGERFTTMQRDAAFVTAAQEHLHKTLKAAVNPLGTALDGTAIDVSFFCDLFGQGIVPQLPAQLFGEFASDLAAAATILPLDSNDSIQPWILHSLLLSYPNFGFHGHTRPQHVFLRLPGVERDFDRNPLYDFHVIPGGIFRRQQA